MLQTVQQQVNVFFPLKIVIDAPRITLSPIRPFFASFVHKEYTHKISECLFRQPCEAFTDTRLRILNDIDRMIERKLSSFIICENRTGKPVGCATLNHKKASPKIEVWIAEDYQRKGYGAQAVLALKMYAKRNLPPHQYLTAMVSKQNIPAKMLFENLGAELRHHLTFKPNELGKDGILVTYRLYH